MVVDNWSGGVRNGETKTLQLYVALFDGGELFYFPGKSVASHQGRKCAGSSILRSTSSR